MRYFALLLIVTVFGALDPGVQARAQEWEATGEESEPPRPHYHLLRHEEDWSMLRGNTGEDYLDPLKYIPLAHGGDAFLTLGGEARTDTRLYKNEQWGTAARSDAFLLQRLMLHGSLHAKALPHGLSARTFIQLKSGLIAGRNGPVYPPDRDSLDVNQAFLALTLPLGRSWSFKLRIGRQELHYGAGRMIAVREGPNVRFGYDALLGRLRGDAWQVDAFVAKPNETAPGIFDNGWMQGRTLWGTHVQQSPAAKEEGYALYYFGFKRAPSPLSDVDSEIRHTVGGRWHGRTSQLRYDLEAALQVGRFRGAGGTENSGGRGHPAQEPIWAWKLSGHFARDFPEAPARLTVGLAAELSSGDAGGSRRLETFEAPYPSGRFTGAGNVLGPGNLLNVRSHVAARLTPSLRVEASSYFFWRLQPTDGVYAIWGAPLFPGHASSERFVGIMPETSLTWQVGRHLSTTLEASHFFAGSFLKQTLAGKDMAGLTLRARYIF